MKRKSQRGPQTCWPEQVEQWSCPGDGDDSKRRFGSRFQHLGTGMVSLRGLFDIQVEMSGGQWRVMAEDSKFGVTGVGMVFHVMAMDKVTKESM